MEKKESKFFYGWIVVIACMLLSASATGLLAYLNSLFITPVTEELGIPRTQYMLSNTCYTITTMLVMPFIGTVFQKFPMKRIIIIAACLGGAAHLCYSMATGVVFFYIGSIIAGFSTGFFGAIPIAILTTNWFNEKRGLATGLAFAGTGLASSIFSPIVSHIIANYGWRMAYRFIAAAIVVIVVLTVLLLIKEQPSDMGLKPLGEIQTVGGEKVGFTKKQVFQTKSFWVYLIAIFLFGFVTNPTQTQLVAYWTDIGISSSAASIMYSVVMAISIVAKIVLGSVYDKAGIKKATLIIGCIAVGAFVTLNVCTKGVSVLIPAVLFGLTTAIQVIAATYVASRLFGDKEYASIYGFLTPVLYVGVAIGSPVSASIYEMSGSYQVTWIIFAVMTGVATLALLIADTLSKKEFKAVLGLERR